MMFLIFSVSTSVYSNYFQWCVFSSAVTAVDDKPFTVLVRVRVLPTRPPNVIISPSIATDNDLLPFDCNDTWYCFCRCCLPHIFPTITDGRRCTSAALRACRLRVLFSTREPKGKAKDSAIRWHSSLAAHHRLSLSSKLLLKIARELQLTSIWNSFPT